MSSVTAASAEVVCRLPVPPPFTSSIGATARTASTTAARRSAISRAERLLMKRITGRWRGLPSGRSPTPAMCDS